MRELATATFGEEAVHELTPAAVGRIKGQASICPSVPQLPGRVPGEWSCPPCVVCDEVVVATLSTSLSSGQGWPGR
jgi:hypothetical protein